MKRTRPTSYKRLHLLLSGIGSSFLPLADPSKELDELPFSVVTSVVLHETYLDGSDQLRHHADTLVPGFQ